MTTTHTLTDYDGYGVGDRLLEGVRFKIAIVDDGTQVRATDVAPQQLDDPYIQKLRWENFAEAIKRDVQHSIDHLVNVAAAESTTFADLLAQHEKEYGEPGIQVLLEV